MVVGPLARGVLFLVDSVVEAEARRVLACVVDRDLAWHEHLLVVQEAVTGLRRDQRAFGSIARQLLFEHLCRVVVDARVAYCPAWVSGAH